MRYLDILVLVCPFSEIDDFSIYHRGIAIIGVDGADVSSISEKAAEACGNEFPKQSRCAFGLGVI
ncbi:hypothetical protein BMUNKI379_23550 [Burkholderia multivorans]|uniref:Uncharacterized protein n=1 Tax=Burkholderia multivorans TaxID=87883 RepID=A0A2S9MCP3_9BURK|nr:hypothetical protein BMUNKI379_23550 [Burkholderia multivorans]PRF55208.1 hypothetical protein C6Q15_26545 [Burkholderia multivorans]